MELRKPNIDKLQKATDQAVETSRNAIFTMASWANAQGLVLSGHEPMPDPVSLFARVTTMIDDTLTQAGLPKLDQFYLWNMGEDQGACVVLNDFDDPDYDRSSHGYSTGIAYADKQLPLGVMLGVIVPNVQQDVAAAFE